MTPEARNPWPAWYGIRFNYEYKSPIRIGSWPLVHVAAGFDPLTQQYRIARGVIAVGSVAVGGVAVGSVAIGVVAVGAVSFGLLFAVGSVAIGAGLSIGAVAIGSVAIGAVAGGLISALGAVAK